VTSNAQLIANAGSTQTVKQGDVVKLTAAQSTATNAVINSYQWQFTNKPTSSTTQLENSTRVNSQFIADKVGEYSVKLTITNSVGDTAS
ncbi:PKD domain-containing protein, partial [Anaerobacillus sp. 1_MG-2023]|nr:PKD domain-containing protein [Anaerobacillus sp. 1_MG-2023]